MLQHRQLLLLFFIQFADRLIEFQITLFALNIAQFAALEMGVPVAIFSLEMAKEQLATRMLAAEARVDSQAVRRGMLRDTDFIIVAVPTPIDAAHQPDFSPLVGASVTVGRHMKKGATVVCGGRIPPGQDCGWFYEPTILTGVNASMKIFHEECFGPVAAICRVADFDEAVRLANDSPFAVWLSRFAQRFPRDGAIHRLDFADASPDDAEGWGEWLPEHLALVPLRDRHGAFKGVVLYAAEQPWSDHACELLGRLHATYGYCLAGMRQTSTSSA